MTKADLIAAVAKATQTPASKAGAVINAAVEAVTEALRKGEKVQLTGFGTFEVRMRKARTGVNPRTGEKVKIKAGKAPAFRAGKSLKDIVAAARRAPRRA